jgi:hypothetical protein
MTISLFRHYRVAIFAQLLSVLGTSCSAGVSNTANSISEQHPAGLNKFDLVHLGLSLELPANYKLVTKENLDSTKHVIRSLSKLHNPCNGSLVNVQEMIKNENMQMLVDVENARNSIVAARHPRLSFTQEQASSAMASICGKMFYGFNMTRVSESSGTLPIGTYYKVKFFIEGPEWDYVSTTYLVTSKLRSYTVTFNGDGIKDQLGVLSSVKESSVVIEAAIDWSEYLAKINPSFQRTLLDSSMFYLYQTGSDTTDSEAGSVITIPQCCVFTLPEGTELQSSNYRKYSQAVISMVGRNDNGSFWLQQKGINQGNREAFKTYFRFTVSREALPPEDSDIVLANLSKADIDYIQLSYESTTRAALLGSQKIESIHNPEEFRFGPYFGVRLGHTRSTDGKGTVSKRMIVIAYGNRYIIEAGYRLEHREQWEAVLKQLLNSLVLL